MEKVYSGQYFEAMNVKNLLENLNIHVFVENDNMSLIEPFAVSPGGTSPVVLKVNKQNYNQAIETIKAYENGELALGKEIDKSVIIAMLKKEGFVVDLTLQDDCLYCAATDTAYFINTFKTVKEISYNEDGIAKKIRAVASEEFGIKGYYIY
jgi:hypothetical protein